MAAKKKPLTVAVGGRCRRDERGLEAATTAVDGAEPRPPKSAGQIVKDEGDGGAKVAEFLASQKLI